MRWRKKIQRPDKRLECRGFFEDAANCFLEMVYVDMFCASVDLSTTYGISIFVWFLALCRVVEYQSANGLRSGGTSLQLRYLWTYSRPFHARAHRLDGGYRFLRPPDRRGAEAARLRGLYARPARVRPDGPGLDAPDPRAAPAGDRRPFGRLLRRSRHLHGRAGRDLPSQRRYGGQPPRCSHPGRSAQDHGDRVG